MKKLLVALLVLGLAAPVMAAEVGFYGSFRTHLGYYDVSDEYGAGSATSAAGPYGGPDYDGTISSGSTYNALTNPIDNGNSDAGTVLGMSNQSRFGAKAKVTDTLNAVFEMGLNDTSRTVTNQMMYLRLAYGVWNFGAGSLTFGKAYTPLTYLLYSGQVADLGDNGEAIMLVAGIPYAGRRPQIKLSIAGFELALIQPNAANAAGTVASNPNSNMAPYTDDIDYSFPKVEAAYNFNTPMLSIRPAFGFQTYKAVERTGDESDKSVTSWIGALGVQLRFNPVYVNMMGSYQVNPYNYGISNLALGPVGGTTLSSARIVGGDTQDAEVITGIATVGAKLSPMLKVEGGFGMSTAKQDLTTTADMDQTAYIYYVQAPITVAPGVTITPEVGMIDRGDISSDLLASDWDQGKMTYGVASFRIDF